MAVLPHSVMRLLYHEEAENARAFVIFAAKWPKSKPMVDFILWHLISCGKCGIIPCSHKNCCLSFFPLFCPRRQKSSKRTPLRAEPTVLPKNPTPSWRSLFAFSETATAYFVSAIADTPPPRRSASGLIKRPIDMFLLVEQIFFRKILGGSTVRIANGNENLIFTPRK